MTRKTIFCRPLTLSAGCACALALFFASGCNQSGQASSNGSAPAQLATSRGGGSGSVGVRRVIMLNNGPDPFWDAMRAGMMQAQKDFNLSGAKLQAVMDEGNGTSKAQIDKLKNYGNETDVAAVAISATDAKSPALADAMRDLQKQGIKVITIDSDVDRATARDARFAYLGTDNIIGGRQLGLAAKGLRPNGGKYVCFVGLKSASNARERHDGFAQGAGDKFKELEYLGDGMDLSVAQKNVQDAINRNKDVDTFVGIWAYNSHAIVQVLDQEPDVRKRSIVVAFDASPLALGHMADGRIDALIVQNPYQMGYEGVRLMKALVTGDQKPIGQMFPAWDQQQKKFTRPEGDIFTTELRAVVPDRGSPLTKANFDPHTVFFKLGDFQKWLRARGLEGS